MKKIKVVREERGRIREQSKNRDPRVYKTSLR